MQIVSIALSLFVALLSASQVAAKCPLQGRCPYVATTESTGRTDCPLKTGNCPYYTQHAKDASVADYLTSKDGKCPLEGKCPFYKDLKDGKTVDLTGSNCPIKDTWCEQFPDQRFRLFSLRCSVPSDITSTRNRNFQLSKLIARFSCAQHELVRTTRLSSRMETILNALLKSHGE
ncbi:hypothetical protein HDU78_009009 [Chytriomyces hyalinus]|nr:hypothetical protein HDU78_009009 [Chytriomyces hyalinus]